MINKTLRILKVLEYVSILFLLYLSDLNHICKFTFEFVFVFFSDYNGELASSSNQWGVHCVTLLVLIQ